LRVLLDLIENFFSRHKMNLLFSKKNLAPSDLRP